MTPQELKNSILQLAIQGKLVEQRPEEGTAEELYRQIQEEKHHLQESGLFSGRKKINLLPISEDGIPFDIPESWQWIRLGNVSEIFGRIGFRGYTKNDIVLPGNGAITISPSNLLKDGNTDFSDCTYISWKKYEESPEIKVFDGDILIVKTGSSYGKSCIVSNLPNKATINPQLAIIKYILCNVKYLQLALASPMARVQYETFVIGTSIPTFSQEKLANLLIPLPPLAEQKRIVAKIEELLPLIDRYEKAWTRLEEFNKRFPDDLQKSLLQMAIQGKLVEQRPEEGTGEELYQQIQKEKQELIRAGKIKKEKPLPEITEEERPFDIPETWKWVRLDDLVSKEIKRGKSPVYTQKSNTLVFAQKCNTKAGYIDLSIALYLDESKLNKYPKSEFMVDNDIVINSTGNGTLGRVGHYKSSDNPRNLPLVPDSHVTVIRANSFMCVDYMFFGLKYYQPYMEKLGSGSTNQTELSAGLVKSLLFPVPPLAEQKRIVAKLEELLPLCERMKSCEQ